MACWLTGLGSAATSAKVRRLKLLVIALVILPLVGSEASWAFAVAALNDGSHYVSLRATGRHLDIVLEHDIDPRLEHDHDVRLDAHDHHSHGDHPDHVVSLSSVERVSTASRLPQPHRGWAVAFASAIDRPTMHVRPMRLVASSRVRPPAPPRSSLLQI